MASQQASTDDQLAASRAQGEELAKELQEAQQAASAAAEAAGLAKQYLEQQLAELQDTQVTFIAVC